MQLKFSGPKVRVFRLDAGLSREALARVFPVSHVTIWRWETGLAEPSADILPPLADALGVEITDLYADDELVTS